MNSICLHLGWLLICKDLLLSFYLFDFWLFCLSIVLSTFVKLLVFLGNLLSLPFLMFHVSQEGGHLASPGQTASFFLQLSLSVYFPFFSLLLSQSVQSLQREQLVPPAAVCMTRQTPTHYLHPPFSLPERSYWLTAGPAVVFSMVHRPLLGAQMDGSLGCPGLLCRGTFFPFVMDVWSVVNQGGEKRDDSCYHDVGFCNGFKCKSTLKHKIWNLFGAFYKKLLMWLLFCVCYFLNDISSTYFTFLKSLILYSIRQTMKDIDPILKTVS